MRHLRWLSLLGALALLGFIPGLQLFFALAGFVTFVTLFWSDERTEAIFRQAATNTFVVMTMTFAATFIYIAIPAKGTEQLLSAFATALAVSYGLFLLTFASSFVYYSFRGFKS